MAKASLEDLYSDSTKPAPSKDEVPAAEREPVIQAEEAAEPAAEAKTEAETEQEPAEAAGKGDKSPAKAEKKDVPPTSEEEDAELPPDVIGLKAAAIAERNKRRDWKSKAVKIEAELAALRSAREAEAKELAEYREHARRLAIQGQQPAQPQSQQPQQAAPQPPDYYTDPEGRAAWDRQQLENSIRERELATQQALYERSAETSRRLMKMQHPDYDDIEKVFVEAAQKDPAILQDLVKHPFPAEYAYAVGKEMKARQEIQKAGSLEALIEQRAAAKLAELQAQAAQTAAQPVSPRAAPPQSRAAQPAPPPQSLAGVTSMAPRSRQPNTGPTPLADLYKQ